MSRSYFTEDAKMAYSSFPAWSFDACCEIQNTLNEKGYLMSVVSRVGCDRKFHDAWQVERADVPRLIEQLFRQRICVEVQAEGHGKASINFCYDYSEAHILSVVKRFHRNKRSDML